MMLEQLVQNPENITFPILFVGLLFWVMRTNDRREQDYRDSNNDLRKALLNNSKMEGQVNEIYKATVAINKREVG